MFPYRDNLSNGPRGKATLSLIALLGAINVPIFIVDGLQSTSFSKLAFSPLNFSLHPLIKSYTLISASFLHGDVFHLAGNCLFLFVFGTSLERLLGWRVYLLSFPVLGVAGFLLEWVVHPNSDFSVVGSSGAVAALMGAYLPLFPRARIRFVAFWGLLWKRFSLPAWVFLFYWIGSQVFSLVLGTQDGVAYAVHIGSFMAGAIAAVIWKTSYPFAEEHLDSTVGGG
jgi:membrane associated rhomboid family serine protease